MSRVRIPYKPKFFFQAFLFATAWLSCIYNCDDLPSNNSSLRSSHICFSYIHNFKSETCFNQSEALWVVTPHWSSSVDPRALVRRRFSWEPVVVGHSQANRQSYTLFFCWGIFTYVTLYHCYRVMLQKVLQTDHDLFPQKIWNIEI